MDDAKDWLFPSTPVGALMRIRPRSLALFRRHRLDPWEAPETQVAELCRRGGVNASVFLHELGALPIPGADSPWFGLPCHDLVDFLTAEHRSLQHVDVPAIRYMLDMGFSGEPGGEEAFRSMTQALGSFCNRLLAHIREEEEDIFPALLRHEFLVLRRDRQGVHAPHLPDRETERLFAAARLTDAEEAAGPMAEAFREGALPKQAKLGRDRVFAGLEWMFKALYAKLRAHARLESEVLLPMATRLEREVRIMAACGSG